MLQKVLLNALFLEWESVGQSIAPIDLSINIAL